jgi:class 3 adenylate cyclase
MSVEAAFCSSCGAALRPDARRAASASDREERRVVTVLFADLAGSTALGESLDPEDVRAVQTELFELVDREVVRHGGVTEKYVGDAVVARLRRPAGARGRRRARPSNGACDPRGVPRARRQDR